MAYIKSRKHGQTTSPAPLRTNLIGAAVLASLVLPAGAQTAEGTTQLPAVTVRDTSTADYKADTLSSPKFTQPLVDTPQTISVIKEQVIREQSATTLTEALRNTPGASTFMLGENGNTNTGDSIYMRGFDSANSIYVDGVRDIGSISRDVFNTEQVEVIKGPSGSDYGRSAPSGSINMVTKQPKLEDNFSVSAGMGSADYKRGSLDWNQTLPGIEGAAIRLNAVTQDAGVAGRDEIQNKHWAIAPSIAFGLNTPTRTYLNLMHVEQENVPDGGVFTIGMPGYKSPDSPSAASYRPQLNNAKRVDSSNYYGTNSDHDDVTADMATLRFEHDFNAETKLNNTTRWGKTKQDYLLTSFLGQGYSATNTLGGSPLVTPDINDPSTWTLRRNINTKDQENEILTNQTNFITRLMTAGIQHDLSVGLELIREKQTNHTLAPPSTVTSNVSVYNPNSNVNLPKYSRNGAGSEGQTDTVAIYAFDTLKLSEQWWLNAGLRLDHYKTTYDSKFICATGTGTTSCTALGQPANTLITNPTLDGDGTLLNYKVGVLFKPAANGSIYVNYALSQQPPGGANFTLSSAAGNANNPNLDPQEAKTTEVGSKWELLDKRLLLTGALFRTVVENEINTTVTPADQTGKKIVSGAEFGVIGQITNSWAISAGYMTQDAKVEKGAGVSQDGSDDLSYTPGNAFTFWSTYQLASTVTVGGGARYVGGMKRGTDGAIGTPNYTESYTVLDAMASYRFNKNLDVQLNLFNLTDEEYVASINKSGYRYIPGMERSGRVTVNYTF